MPILLLVVSLSLLISVEFPSCRWSPVPQVLVTTSILFCAGWRNNYMWLRMKGMIKESIICTILAGCVADEVPFENDAHIKFDWYILKLTLSYGIGVPDFIVKWSGNLKRNTANYFAVEVPYFFNSRIRLKLNLLKLLMSRLQTNVWTCIRYVYSIGSFLEFVSAKSWNSTGDNMQPCGTPEISLQNKY